MKIIIMYDLSRIDELPAIINKVLSDDSLRKHTADAAYLLAKEKSIHGRFVPWSFYV